MIAKKKIMKFLKLKALLLDKRNSSLSPSLYPPPPPHTLTHTHTHILAHLKSISSLISPEEQDKINIYY